MRLLDWLGTVLTAVGDVLTFRAPTSLVTDAQAALPTAVGVAVLAAAATMVAHVVVFMINRVTGWRMVAGLSLGAVYTVALRVLMAVTVAVAAGVATAGRVDGGTVGICYLFALAPLTLSFLVFVPHFGLVLGRVLEGWTLLCLVALLSPALGIGRWSALALSGAAWLLTQALSRLLARPLAALTSRLWTLATGHDTFVTAQDILTGAPFVPLERAERRA